MVRTKRGLLPLGSPLDPDPSHGKSAALAAIQGWLGHKPHRIQESGHAAPRLCVKPQQFVQVTSGVIMLVGGSQPALSCCAGAGAVTVLLSIGVTIGSGTGAFAATICSSRLAGATRLFSSPSTPLTTRGARSIRKCRVSM